MPAIITLYAKARRRLPETDAGRLRIALEEAIDGGELRGGCESSSHQVCACDEDIAITARRGFTYSSAGLWFLGIMRRPSDEEAFCNRDGAMSRPYPCS